MFLDQDQNGVFNASAGDTYMANIALTLTVAILPETFVVYTNETDLTGCITFRNVRNGTATLGFALDDSRYMPGITTAGSGGGTVASGQVTGIVVPEGSVFSGYLFTVGACGWRCALCATTPSRAFAIRLAVSTPSPTAGV